MESLRKNKSLYIDKEAIFALLLCKEGLLYPVTRLMNKQEMQEVDESGIYLGKNFPFSFILAPSGRRNQEVMINANKGDIILLVCEGVTCGELVVEESFPINKDERLFKIMYGDIYSNKAKNIYSRIGDYAICGEYKLSLNEKAFSFPYRVSKEKILYTKRTLQAKTATAMVIHAAPITRIHERIFRSLLDESDLLILLLARHQEEELLDFDIRKKCLEFIVSNFLPKERILIFSLDNIYLFAGAHGLILDAILAQNLGCNTLAIGENHPNLGVFFDNQEIHSIFNTARDINIKIKLLSEYTYCNLCQSIVSIKTCPHGQHHHVSFHTDFIKDLLKEGFIPPSILVRKEISAKILSHLYPNRCDFFVHRYSAILARDGIIQERNDEEFYIKLIELYQTSSLN